jgi:transposase
MEPPRIFNESELSQLSKEEIVQLVLQLQKLVTELVNEVEAQRMKVDHNRKPPTTSQNSSQPPSRDQKKNAGKDRRKHRHGPPKGHEKHKREMVADPDHVVHVRADHCEYCQAEMKEEGRLIRINQITEIPEIRSEVIEVRQYEQTCPCCRRKQISQPPQGLEMDRTFGSRLESTVTYYRQEQHISYQRTLQSMLHLYGVNISEGGIDGIMQKGGNLAIPQGNEIEEQVRQSAVVYSDETGSRVESNNWSEWVFCTSRAILHVLRFNRSSDVIHDVMRKVVVDVWVSDCFSAQLKSAARQRQLCLAHQIRNLQAVVDAHPTLTWPGAMQVLFRYAIHLHHQRSHLSPDQFAAQVDRIEYHMDRLLKRSLEPPDAARLQRRYQKHRDCLFVFLHRNDVEPTNNVAERALRHSVIHRKVIGCFRSAWGAKAYAALASVIDTAELKGVDAFAAIQNLFGTPSLPIPVVCE